MVVLVQEALKCTCLIIHCKWFAEWYHTEGSLCPFKPTVENIQLSSVSNKFFIIEQNALCSSSTLTQIVEQRIILRQRIGASCIKAVEQEIAMEFKSLEFMEILPKTLNLSNKFKSQRTYWLQITSDVKLCLTVFVFWQLKFPLYAFLIDVLIFICRFYDFMSTSWVLLFACLHIVLSLLVTEREN